MEVRNERHNAVGRDHRLLGVHSLLRCNEQYDSRRLRLHNFYRHIDPVRRRCIVGITLKQGQNINVGDSHELAPAVFGALVQFKDELGEIGFSVAEAFDGAFMGRIIRPFVDNVLPLTRLPPIHP